MRILAACLLALTAGAATAQGFPNRPVTLICPAMANAAIDNYLRPFATIASRYLGQPVRVENVTGENQTLGPARMAASAAPDGYSLAMLTINAFRVPHMVRVNWDPLRDFTYIIGLADYNLGVVVKSDSRFKSFKELIEHAKTNPGGVLYGSRAYGFTSHLVMEDLSLKAGARLLRVPTGGAESSARALNDGRVAAISDTMAELRPYVDSGAFRVLVTFGDRRTRWNAPTSVELGFDVPAYLPLGIAGPKGMDPKVVKLLHDAFNRALDDPEYDILLKRLDMVDLYKSSEDYAEWAVDQFRFQRALIERTIGLGRGFRD